MTPTIEAPVIEATRANSSRAGDDVPRVAATATRTRDGGWDLTIRQCPFCSTPRTARRHTHGGGDGPEPESGGHRVPHCVKPLSDPSRGYVLVVRPATAPEPGQQKRRR